jgi:hypothetical protein
MRIITGKYKGRHFDIPRTFKARPTTDFAKENIFNVLNSYIDFEGINALDLFSGTGSISLELLSRGCEHVVSVEMDRDHHRFIQECFRKLLGDHGDRSRDSLVPSDHGPVPMIAVIAQKLAEAFLDKPVVVAVHLYAHHVFASARHQFERYAACT